MPTIKGPITLGKGHPIPESVAKKIITRLGLRKPEKKETNTKKKKKK